MIVVGTNSLDDYKEQTDLLLQTVPEGHRVILMTPHDGSVDASYNSEKLAVYERSLVNQYKYVTLADYLKKRNLKLLLELMAPTSAVMKSEVLYMRSVSMML